MATDSLFFPCRSRAKIELKMEVEQESLIDTNKYREGGYGWVCVGCSFVVQAFAIGIPATFGIYQQSYKAHSFIGSSSTLAIAFIGSFGSAGLGIAAVPSGRLTEIYGHSLVCGVGGVLMCVSLLLASLATEYWELLVTQGMLFGIACAVAYFPALTILPHWFHKKKGIASGFATAGSGVGGLFLAPCTRYLISQYGTQGCLRVIAIVTGISITICAMLLRTDHTHTLSKQSKMNFKEVLHDQKFIRLFAIAGVVTLGYYVPYFYIPTYAVQYGMSEKDGALVLGLLNGCSGLGRVILGLNGDRFGHLKTLVANLVLASLSILLIWPFATTFGSLTLFGCLYGFFSGGFIALFPTAIHTIFGSKNIATVIGMVYSGFSFGNLFGTPIAGIIMDSLTTFDPDGQKTVNFVPSILVGGFSILIGAGLLLSIRLMIQKDAREKSIIVLSMI